jgi:hypothetical protein
LARLAIISLCDADARSGMKDGDFGRFEDPPRSLWRLSVGAVLSLGRGHP